MPWRPGILILCFYGFFSEFNFFEYTFACSKRNLKYVFWQLMFVNLLKIAILKCRIRQEMLKSIKNENISIWKNIKILQFLCKKTVNKTYIACKGWTRWKMRGLDYLHLEGDKSNKKLSKFFLLTSPCV